MMFFPSLRIILNLVHLVICIINGRLDVFKNICARSVVVWGVNLLMGALKEVNVLVLPSAV